MLTGKLVRVRYVRQRIIPNYVDVHDAALREAAERLLDLFRGREGRTRGELEEEVRDTFGSETGQLVHQGLAKLLEDRCEFEVVAGHPPEQLREAVFRAAAQRRAAGEPLPVGAAFDRTVVLQEVAAELSLTAEQVDVGLFADLKSEQRLIAFEDVSAERLLQRYNVALAQAVLLRATQVRVTVRGEPPQRYRQLLRQVKFHRLICDVRAAGRDAYVLQLDGPLSLFSATQKYGLQLALFLPAVLHCRDFDLQADLRWGPQRKEKTFALTPADGLVSPAADLGMYLPPELKMFAELFRKKVADWDITDDVELLPLDGGFWVPDFRLVHSLTGRSVYLDVLGFWRKASVERHLARLRTSAGVPFVLAVDQLHIDDSELEGLPAGVHRFRQMPLPDEVAQLAEEQIRKVTV